VTKLKDFNLFSGSSLKSQKMTTSNGSSSSLFGVEDLNHQMGEKASC